MRTFFRVRFPELSKSVTRALRNQSKKTEFEYCWPLNFSLAASSLKKTTDTYQSLFVYLSLILIFNKFDYLNASICFILWLLFVSFYLTLFNCFECNELPIYNYQNVVHRPSSLHVPGARHPANWGSWRVNHSPENNRSGRRNGTGVGITRFDMYKRQIVLYDAS